jgi:hypothetical protein
MKNKQLIRIFQPYFKNSVLITEKHETILTVNVSGFASYMTKTNAQKSNLSNVQIQI